MTTNTTAFERLADAAVSARGQADRIYRFGLGDRIPAEALKKNADGTYTIAGVDFLKSGSFNGLGLVDADLEAMVAHFTALRDAGIFLPPFRLDHSWSVLSVIGWIEELETYRRVDSTDSMEKTFLRGDVRITGSVDYTPEQIVKAIKAGSLRNRSSELGYYVTNSGVEIPLAFYGCAYVDIPAVEGLAPVTLSRVRLSTPHEIVTLTEGSARMDPEKIARLAALRALTSLSAEEEAERDTLEEEATATGTDVPDAEPVETPAGGPEIEPPAADEETPAGDSDAGNGPAAEDVEEPTPAGEVVADRAPETPEQTPEVSAELAAARAEITRLRAEAADRDLVQLRERGIVNRENEDAARTLLTHDDEGVRRVAGTLLASVPSPVTLGRRQGTTSLSREGNGTPGRTIQLGAPASEVGPLWANLTREQRVELEGEYLEWRRHRDENNLRD